jgi:hypothetical protein
LKPEIDNKVTTKGTDLFYGNKSVPFLVPEVEADFFGFDDSVFSTAKQNLT